MVWYGMVWMVWLVWSGLVWSGMVWYGMVFYGIVLCCILVLCGVVLYSILLYGQLPAQRQEVLLGQVEVLELIEVGDGRREVTWLKARGERGCQDCQVS